MEVIITKAIVWVFSVIGFILATYIIGYVRNLKDNSQLAFIYDIVATAVNASEQIFVDKGSGKEKREEATEFIKGYLYKIGIRLSDEEIRTILESAVYDLKKEQEQISTNLLIEKG